MARLLGPDTNGRMVYVSLGGSLRSAAGLTAVVYAGQTGSTVADIAAYNGTGTPGAAVPDGALTVDADSLLPMFWYPDGVDTVFISVAGGTRVAVHADADARLDNMLPLTGGTMTGPLTLADGSPAASQEYVTEHGGGGSDPGKLDTAGGAMTGPLVLAGDPANGLQAAPKQYVDSATAGKVDVAGDTMTGPLVLVDGSPAASEDWVGGRPGRVEVAKSGNLVGTRPRINLIPGANVTLTVADNPAGNRVDVTVTAAVSGGGGGVAGWPTPALYDVEEYGAIGDGVTDDGPAIVAAWNAGVASEQDFYLVFPRPVEYLVNVDDLLVPSAVGGGQYAVFHIPKRLPNTTTHKQMCGVIGPGQACSTRVFPGDGQATIPVTNTAVVKVAYTTPPTYDATHGWPSLFGGPDRDKDGAFSNVHVHWKGVTVRQPPNPAMCALNLEGAATCHVEDFFADVTGNPEATPRPTRPTGASILWPRNGNAATVVGGRVGAWGYYGGPGFGEHLVLDFAYALRCVIGHPIREGLGHAATITWTTTEECVYTIAGYNGLDGVTAVPSGGNDPTIKMGLSIEDFGYGSDPWYYAVTQGTNIYDPDNRLRGIIWFERSDASPTGNGATSQMLARGASNVVTVSLRTGATAAKIQQWVDPIPVGTTAPGAPTVGSATAGDASASVSFTPPAADGGSAITGYTVTSNPGGLTASGSASPISISGLTNGTAYTFTVRAVNAVGTSSPSAASNTVTPASVPGATAPDPPTIGAATAGNAAATVAFTAPADDGGSVITGYTATASPGDLTGTSTTSPITVTGLANGTDYTFTVHATNSVGSSVESAASNTVTPAAPGVSTYAADTFNRADDATTLGTSSGGQTWTALDGTWGILSGRVRNVANGSGAYAVAALDAGHSAVTYTINLYRDTDAIDLGLTALVQDADNLIFWDLSADTSGVGSTRLFQRSGGAFTGITSGVSVTLNPGTTYALKMVVAPTSISCYIDNALIFASSGATGLEGNTRFGLMTSAGASDHDSTWEDLLITS